MLALQRQASQDRYEVFNPEPIIERMPEPGATQELVAWARDAAATIKRLREALRGWEVDDEDDDDEEDPS
jgi:hypothetical protein